MSGTEQFPAVVEELTKCFGTEAVDWHEFEGMRTIYLRAGPDAMGHRCDRTDSVFARSVP
jgi:hypothetical protein